MCFIHSVIDHRKISLPVYIHLSYLWWLRSVLYGRGEMIDVYVPLLPVPQLPHGIFPAIDKQLRAKKQAQTCSMSQAWPNTAPEFLQGLVTFPCARPSHNW